MGRTGVRRLVSRRCTLPSHPTKQSPGELRLRPEAPRDSDLVRAVPGLFSSAVSPSGTRIAGKAPNMQCLLAWDLKCLLTW